MAEQLCGALQSPLLLLLLHLHDYGLHLQQRQRLGHVLGGLCCYWGEIPCWAVGTCGSGGVPCGSGPLSLWYWCCIRFCLLPQGCIGLEILSVYNWQPLFHPIENETTWQGETTSDSQSGGVPAPQLLTSGRVYRAWHSLVQEWICNHSDSLLWTKRCFSFFPQRKSHSYGVSYTIEGGNMCTPGYVWMTKMGGE